MKYLKTLMLAACSVAFVACGGSDDPAPDTTKPVISITSPSLSTDVAVGSDFKVTGTITDNIDLKNYTIEVSFVGPTTKTTLYDFDFDRVNETISGKEFTIPFEAIEVPAATNTGNYKLTVTATDKSGNKSTKDYDFNIINPTN